MTKKKPLGECEVTPSGMDGIISLTINEVYFISCPIAFGKWIANIKKSLCTICTICTMEGGKCRKCRKCKAKNDIRIVRILRNLTFLSANFYTGMACRAMDDVRSRRGTKVPRTERRRR